jgi:hypothetical protein
VLLPLIAVLGWPAATVLSTHQAPNALQLEAPPLIGFALVLVMGCGNYVGTRFGSAACLFAAGQCLVVMPATRFASQWSVAPDEYRAAGMLLCLLAAAVARRAASRPPPVSPGVNRLWCNFRDTFGIVWAHRLQERINAEAAREQWPARLMPDGFVWDAQADEPARARTLRRIDHTLRWLLRRFVDDSWIDERLARPPSPNLD